MEIANLSFPIFDGIEDIQLFAIFLQGSAFFGKRKFYGGVILQPCSKEVGSVVGVRRLLDERVETTSDLTERMFEKFYKNLSGRYKAS